MQTSESVLQHGNMEMKIAMLQTSHGCHHQQTFGNQYKHFFQNVLHVA